MQFFEQRTDLTQLQEAVSQIKQNIGQLIVGQSQMVELMIAGLLSDGHLLIEGVPGVAKTLAAKLLAKSIQLPFSRIQFTPDLMPGDVIGTTVFNPQAAAFQFKPGPIFSHIVLIDEINRAPAKTQSALFEVMEERQITYDGTTYALDAPFLVLATQNPIEQEGTYRLPEAQLDRFIFKITVDYPDFADEVRILQNQQHKTAAVQLQSLQAVLQPHDILAYRQVVQSLVMEQKLIEFIARIITLTRNNSSLYLAASPRASLAVMKASKAFAAMRGRDFVLPEDILEVVPHVLRHRIMLTPEKEMEGLTPDDLIKKMIASVEVPR
ncbi:MAG: MoxR family ATPase [Bacteroidetes bacterium]|nr:MAG: MoxR family ATPase [Bacteroidota bacterium]